MHLLASVSDFNNKYFNYEQTETNLNNIIKVSFESMGVKQAFYPFINIASGDKVSASTKLANKLLKEFSKSQQGVDLEKAHTYQFVKIMEKYASHGWMMANTYNSLIQAFGTNFEKFTMKELSSFCHSLGEAGLRQGDIFDESLNRIKTLTDKNTPEEGGRYLGKFNSVALPIFDALIELDKPSPTALELLIDEEFNKRAFYGGQNFFEHAKSKNTDHVHVLLTILKGSLDQSDPRFKELAEELVALINKSTSFDINDDLMSVYHALVVAKSPLATEFTPKVLDTLKQINERSLKTYHKRNPTPL